MEPIKEFEGLTKKDSFLVCVSVKKGKNIETKCVANEFAYADIPIAARDISKNIQKIAVQVEPAVPAALQDDKKEDDMVVYAEDEE